MSFLDILSLWTSGLVFQLVSVWLYMLTYRRALRAVSQREIEIFVPAFWPVLGTSFWVLALVDYSSVYGLEQALRWTWWQPVGAVIGFLFGNRFAAWYRRRKIGLR